MKKTKLLILPIVLVAASLVGCGDSSVTSVASSVASSTAPVSSTVSSVSSEAASSTSTLPTTNATIAELAAKTASDTSKLYSVTGIIEGMKKDIYGNAYLTDPSSGKSIMVYGATTTASCITYTESSGYAFKNPKDGDTTLVDVNDGELVNMTVVYTYFSATKTPEIMGIVNSHTAATTKYTASLETLTNGSAVLDKTSNLTYGDTVTVTCTPNSGYKVDSVKVDNAYGGSVNATVDSSDVNKFTFAATCVNKVDVTFVSASLPQGDVSYDIVSNASGFADATGGSIGTTYGEFSNKINGVTFSTTKANYSKCGTAWTNTTIVNAAVVDSDKVVTPAYFTVVSTYNFTKISVVAQNWNTDATIVSLEYSADGTTWSADATAAVNNTSGDAAFTIASSSTFSGKYARVKITTAGTKATKYRVGIQSVTLTYPSK